MSDPTEQARRLLLQEASPKSREEIAVLFNSDVYDTRGMLEEFEVLSFLAPFVFVRRRADGARGSLLFQHSPRLYWSFVPA